MPEAARIRVTVVHALPGRAYCVEVWLPAGSSVADAIESSGIRAAVPAVALHPQRLGIHARRVTPDAIVCDGDRVEIYRPLQVDPKEARRRRARGR